MAARIPTSLRHLQLACTVLMLSLSAQATKEITGPCHGCHLFNLEHKRHPEKKPDTVFCHYPCQCPIHVLDCQGQNRTEVKDGCGCCYTCARRLSESCSVRDVCDKELFCDRKDDKSFGVCKDKNQKNPCLVNGATFQDGETFALDCAQTCTCQNGFYGCVSKCPHEMNKPSELTCHDPKLVKVKNKCCKEWTCQKVSATGSSVPRGMESGNLVKRNPPWQRTTPAPLTTTLAPPPERGGVASQPCRQQRDSDWTPCSVTCGTGVSVRTVVDRQTCSTVQQLRLCLIRPCHETFNRTKCSPTVKSEGRRRIIYQDCISQKDYRLKFCDTCRKDKCCYPRRTRQRTIEFQCSRGQQEVLEFMWIQKCRCSSKCYKKGSSKRARRRRQRLKKKRNNKRKLRRERRRNMKKSNRKKKGDKKKKSYRKRMDNRGSGRRNGGSGS